MIRLLWATNCNTTIIAKLVHVWLDLLFMYFMYFLQVCSVDAQFTETLKNCLQLESRQFLFDPSLTDMALVPVWD